ncbi:MAG: hypothetical protein JWN34_3137 [Bryobacterales bacterium]|jgi:hypothetical protein|nr:hypothetical protein [Bryobacterales bacterium]
MTRSPVAAAVAQAMTAAAATASRRASRPLRHRETPATRNNTLAGVVNTPTQNWVDSGPKYLNSSAAPMPITAATKPIKHATILIAGVTSHVASLCPTLATVTEGRAQPTSAPRALPLMPNLIVPNRSAYTADDDPLHSRSRPWRSHTGECERRCSSSASQSPPSSSLFSTLRRSQRTDTA